MSGQNYKVAWLCEALLVSRSGYYHWKERREKPGPRRLETSRLQAQIWEEFARSRQTYGSPRLAQVLSCPGQRNHIAQLMRKESLFARQPVRKKQSKPRSSPNSPSWSYRKFLPFLGADGIKRRSPVPMRND